MVQGLLPTPVVFRPPLITNGFSFPVFLCPEGNAHRTNVGIISIVYTAGRWEVRLRRGTGRQRVSVLWLG